jgi:hypothetical protein
LQDEQNKHRQANLATHWRAQILADIERELEERRRKEASLEEAVKSLFESKIRLERIEGEYATST